MIFKNLDPFTGSDKFEVAGRRAEEQMAHYLRRFFGSSGDVDVINYLRIQSGGEIAQMDHLVLHPYGLVVVESKSVSGSVQIKDDGQWVRWFNKQPQGMRSPITQAKMQLMMLKELLDKTVKQKGFFDAVRMDVLVAISDSGRIEWPSSGALPEVCKADQVPERLLQRVNQFRRVPGIHDVLTSSHRRVIGEFLLKVHQPACQSRPDSQRMPPSRVSVQSEQAGSKESETLLPTKVCRNCAGGNLEIRHGQFGYYFYCRSCEKNTPIKFKCPQCDGDGRIRKQGNNFFAECKSCDASMLFHTS